MPLRVGLDLDGVIIDHREHKRLLAGSRGFSLETWQTNSNVMKRFLPHDVYEEIQEPLYSRLTPDAPPVAGALGHLPVLGNEVFIVSARRADSVRFAQAWLLKHGVYDIIPAERIFFCGGGDEKYGYCQRLGINLFLDDKISVLDKLPDVTERVLFDEDGVAGMLEAEDKFQVVANWPDFARLVQKNRLR